MWLSLFMTALTAALAIFNIAGFGVNALGDVILILFVAIGLSRYSRVAAIAGVSLYLLSRIMAFTSGTSAIAPNAAMTVFVTLGLVNAVRGTWFHHRRLGSQVQWKHVLIMGGTAGMLTVVVIVCAALVMTSRGDNSVVEMIVETLLVVPVIPFAFLPLVSPLRTTRPAKQASPAEGIEIRPVSIP